MSENNNNKSGRTLVDLLVERPWAALFFLFAIFGGIYFLKIANIGFETPIFKLNLPETQNSDAPTPTTDENGQEIKEPKSESESNREPLRTETGRPNGDQPPIIPLGEREKKKKIIAGTLDFQTPPSSDYYFIKIRGKEEFQRVEKSGGFQLSVDTEETDIRLDVFNKAKEKLTSVGFDCTTSNTIQIIIK